MIDRLDVWEAGLVHVVAKIAPWAAPLPTAYIVWEKTVLYFSWPWWVGLLAAIPIEALGLVTVKLALDLYAYNRAKRKTDPVAPLWIAVGLVAMYLLVALLLTLGLHVAPLIADAQRVTLADWSLAVFPLLSLSAMGAIALRTDHAQRLLEVAGAAQERKRQRVKPKASEPEPELSEPELPFACGYPGCTVRNATQNGMNAHQKVHRNGRERTPVRELQEADK